MSKNTAIISTSVKNDTYKLLMETMHSIGEKNVSQYVNSAIIYYTKAKMEELERKDKNKFLRERLKPHLKEYFKSIRVDHIPDSYIFGNDSSLEKVRIFLIKKGVEIEVPIIKDAILELTMEEDR